jgi:hypothetical protein
VGDPCRKRLTSAVYGISYSGSSQREITRQAGIPRTRVQNILRSLARESAQVIPSASPSANTPGVHPDTSGAPSESLPQVYERAPQTAMKDEAVMADKSGHCIRGANYERCNSGSALPH